MPAPGRFAVPRALVHALAALAPLAAGLWGLDQLTGGGDAAALAWAKAHRQAHPFLEGLAQVVTDWGNIVFYPVYARLLWLGWRRGDRALVRLALAYLCVQLLISFLLVRGLKIFIGKPRPDVTGLFAPFSFGGAHHGMPSGHTAEIVGATLPLACHFRRWGLSLALGMTAAAVALSRVYLGWHSPSDLIMGMLLGGYAGAAIYVFGPGGLGSRSCS